MSETEQTLRLQLAEARQEERDVGDALQEKRARVRVLEAALASRLSPVPLGAIIEQTSRSVFQRKDTARRYRVERLALRGRNDTEVELIGQPLNKDGSDHGRSGPTFIYGDYTVVALPT